VILATMDMIVIIVIIPIAIRMGIILVNIGTDTVMAIMAIGAVVIDAIDTHMATVIAIMGIVTILMDMDTIIIT
jgi:hypothetical protein